MNIRAGSPLTLPPSPGSRIWKVGFSGEPEPRSVFWSTPSSSEVELEAEAWSLDPSLISSARGDRAEGDRVAGISILRNLRKAFFECLMTDPKARKVIVLENTFLPRYVKEHIAQVLFDNLKVGLRLSRPRRRVADYRARGEPDCADSRRYPPWRSRRRRCSLSPLVGASRGSSWIVDG
jgi:hypothetical protein